MNLPANVYTQWYWKTDLHNLFHFLRSAPTPTPSTRSAPTPRPSAASSRDWVPHAWAAFEDYRLNAVHVLRQGDGGACGACSPARR